MKNPTDKSASTVHTCALGIDLKFNLGIIRKSIDRCVGVVYVYRGLDIEIYICVRLDLAFTCGACYYKRGHARGVANFVMTMIYNALVDFSRRGERSILFIDTLRRTLLKMFASPHERCMPMQ